jgi:hypothetical protein
MTPEVHTEVIREDGLWAVYLLVLSSEGVDRTLVERHFTEGRARLAADVIRRTAARRRPPREADGD